MLAYLVAIVLHKKSVKWARMLNPVLITLAFMLDRPIRHVYPEDFQIWSSCITMSCTYLVPWFACETLAG